MARKSIKGYAEKNYYDNTRFNGGIVATNDPLNEGYFKHLVNFDITDTGMSITPRKGFLTTTLKTTKDSTNTVSNQTIYFYDESLGEYIFLDLLNSSNSGHRAWRVGFNSITNFITDCVHISNVDIEDIKSILNYTDSWTLRKIHPINTLQAIRVVDENLVTSYVIKVYYEDVVEGNPTNNYLWLKLFYRKNKTTYGGTTYEGDTLVVSYLDTEDIVDFVDVTQRNIASHQSVIPNPMQVIYTNVTKPDGHINQLPMVYIKNTKGDYLINTTRYIHGLSVIPNYYIVEAPDNYVWAYAYDVMSTNKDLVLIDTAAVHKSNIYNLKTNEIILEDNIDVYGKYYKKMLEYGESYSKLDSLSNKEYISYVSSLNFRINDESLYDDENTLIIYVLPKYANKNPSTGDDMYTCNIMPKTEEDSEILWMLGLHNVKIIGDVSEYLTYIQEYKNLWEEHHMWQPKYTIYRKFDTSLPSGLDKNEAIHIPKDVDELYEMLSTYKDTHTFKVKPLKDVTLDLINDFDHTKGYDSIFQTALNSSIIAFKDQGLDLEELWKYIVRNTNYNRILIRPYTTVSKVEACTSDFTKHHAKYSKKDIFKLFPDSFVEDSDSTRGGVYYLYTDSQWYHNMSEPTIINYEEYLEDIAVTDYPEWRTFVNYFYDVASDYNTFFKTSIEYNNDTDYYTEVSSLPILTSDIVNVIRADGVEVYSIDLKRTSHEYSSLFKYIGNELIATLDDSNETYKMLDRFNYFSEGFNIVFYLMCIPTKEYVNNNSYLSGIIDYNRETFISTYSLSNSRSIITSTDVPNVYTPVLTNDPNAIIESSNYLIFDSMLGNHLVVYKDNKVYISKEGMPHYFTQDYMKEYPEPVVKVIQYKDMLLVFTTQNLYALYLYEDTTTVTTTDSEGNPKTEQQKVLKFATLPVLYNLLTNEKYKDAIQVYNQMVLFYSSDGQMFLIKPTAAIDSNTRFSIQYFNKSANDILLNYKDYIQDRLELYGMDYRIDDVDIKVSASINHIKIFYNAYYIKEDNTKEYVITYVLVYDVLNNRYYSYDTLSFTKINSLHYIPDSEMYITEYNKNLYFTIPYTIPNTEDNNVDIAYYNNFSPYPINTEIDTGTINLNNHLKKRFKDLHVIYKNLNANNLEFRLETFVDDTPIVTYVDSNLEVKDITNTLVVTEVNKVTQLIENTALFNFMDYSSNKIITHKSNIISKGKTIRIRMNFSSKGKYKIQGYGLIYKEHTV